MQKRLALLVSLAAACGTGRDGWPPEIELAGQDPELVRAVETARERVRAAPRSAEANRELARVLDANELDEPADALWQRVVELAPRDARSWYHLARVRERRGVMQEALAALRRTIALEPGYAPAFARAGRLLLETGQLEEAERSFRRALALDAELPAATLGLARLELLRDRPAAAVALLEPFAARAPHEPNVNGLLARAFSMQGDATRAASHLRAEEEAGPPSARDPWQAEVQGAACGLLVRLERSKARLAAGAPAAAWEELEPLEARSGELAVLDTFCQVLLALGRPGEVLGRIQRADESVRTSSLLVVKRVLALRALGEDGVALAELERELARNPAYPGGQALRGEILLDLERPREAVEAFEQARAAGSLSLAHQLQLGRALAASGDIAAGLFELAGAAERFPSAPKPWAYRCELLALEGRDAEARASLEEAKKRGLEPELVARVVARLDELAAAAEEER
jgi:predicted Zn-dependent protease